MVYSEAGGVSKTTTAVSLAMIAALSGKKVVLVDLDPRAATTKWLNVQPKGPGLDVNAILSAEYEDIDGDWASDLAVPSTWSENLRVIPSSRQVSRRETEQNDPQDLMRLRKALANIDADLVIIDCPNRQGGPLTLAALSAADTVVYAAKPDIDGVDGFRGAQETVRKFIEGRKAIGATVELREAGIVVSGLENIATRISRVSLDDLHETGLLLYPIVPQRIIVKEMRFSNEWYGIYEKGDPVVDAYARLAERILI
jgi:chromosome partitioning protein